MEKKKLLNISPSVESNMKTIDQKTFLKFLELQIVS